MMEQLFHYGHFVVMHMDKTKGVNSAREMTEQLFHYGHFVVMHMDKINKGDEQRSTDDGTVISLRPLCSNAYGQDKQRG